MTTLYLTEPYSVVKKDGDTLTVKIPANKESGAVERTERIPMLKVDQVVVLGDSTVTTPALLALLEQNADICFCDFWGYRAALRRQSARMLACVRRNSACTRTITSRRNSPNAKVRGKLHNQKTLLLRNTRQRRRRSASNSGAGQRCAQPNDCPGGCPGGGGGWPARPAAPATQVGVGRIAGDEGRKAAAFFPAFGALLKQPMGFNGRHRRPPTDPVNALLSFGYVLLMNHVMSAVQVVGFDPYIGYLHSEGYGKPSLALDLMEEMRTPIVDSVVLSVVNKQILQPGDFGAVWRLSTEWAWAQSVFAAVRAAAEQRDSSPDL